MHFQRIQDKIPGSPGMAGGAHRALRAHEMMIPYAGLRHGSIASCNKRVYICFILTVIMLAASSMRAADQSGFLVVRADPHTGRLVRRVVIKPRASSAIATPPSIDIGGLVDRTARAHDVDPLLIHSMIKVESNYNPYAVSKKGAEGLMQLMPSTARMLGVSNSFDPGQNIEAGVKYLKYLQGVYKDDRLALAAYNAGPGAVSKHQAMPPYPETQNYVNQVNKRYSEARTAANAQVVQPPVQAFEPAVQVPAPHPKLEQFIDQNGRLHLRTVD